MRRAIAVICCLVVGLQILIGVPAIVCVGFLLMTGGGSEPLAVEVHAGRDLAPPATLVPPPTMAVAPQPALPPNFVPQTIAAPLDNPIVAARNEHGSPFARTVLGQSMSPPVEHGMFMAALAKAVSEGEQSRSHSVIEAAMPESCPPVATSPASAASSLRDEAARFAIEHLYAMADMDERAGEYDRADQWRSFARDIRGRIECESPSKSAADVPTDDC
jgi:hypothetical protein